MSSSQKRPLELHSAFESPTKVLKTTEGRSPSVELLAGYLAVDAPAVKDPSPVPLRYALPHGPLIGHSTNIHGEGPSDTFSANYVRIGTRFQAELPHVRPLPQSLPDDESRWVSDRILPLPKASQAAATPYAHVDCAAVEGGRGAKGCFSAEGVGGGKGVAGGNDGLLGAAYRRMGCHEMGEKYACEWSEEEEEVFLATVRHAEGSRRGLSFWHYLEESLPGRSTRDKVCYYFNVYVTRHRAAQNEAGLDPDSEDDNPNVFGSPRGMSDLEEEEEEEGGSEEEEGSHFLPGEVEDEQLGEEESVLGEEQADGEEEEGEGWAPAEEMAGMGIVNEAFVGGVGNGAATDEETDLEDSEEEGPLSREGRKGGNSFVVSETALEGKVDKVGLDEGVEREMEAEAGLPKEFLCSPDGGFCETGDSMCEPTEMGPWAAQLRELGSIGVMEGDDVFET